MAAPGNYVRAQHLSGSISLAPLSVAKTFVAYIFKSIGWYLPTFAISAALGYTLRRCGLELQTPMWRRDVIRLLAMAIITILPLALLPSHLELRSTVFFGILTSIAIVIAAANLAVPTSRWLNVENSGVSRATVGIASIMAVNGIAHMAITAPFRTEVLASHDQMAHSARIGELDVVLPPQNHRKPSALFISYQISKETDHWINQCVSKYFRLRSIRAAS